MSDLNTSDVQARWYFRTWSRYEFCISC